MNKIFSFICLSISVLIFFYTFYKSEIYWSGDKHDYYFVYYIISLSIFIFSIITFYLNSNVNKYLIIISCSVVFALYAFEIFLTVKYEDNNGNLKLTGRVYITLEEKKKLYKQKTGKEYDTRSKFEVYKDLLEKDSNIKVIIHPSNYIFDIYKFGSERKIFPLSGVSNSRTIFCEELGYYSFYESDRYGFNNPDYEWDKEENEYLLIGDSFTHGACVNRPHDIGSVLRELSGKSVLNLGYSGNGPLIELATLQEYIKPKIKNIIWLYYEGNDMKNLDTELKSQFLKKYIDDINFTQKLKFRQNEIDKISQQLIERASKQFDASNKKEQNIKKIDLIKHIKLTNFRSIANYYLPNKNQPQNPSHPKLKRILINAKKLAEKNNSNFYFVYLPSYSRYKTNYNNIAYDQIKKISKDLNINFIDIHKKFFQLEKNPLIFFPFKSSKHYNIEGYRQIATLINKIVTNE